MSDRGAVLQLCDKVFDEEGVRDATWPWLRDEAGEVFAADGWWRAAHIAVVLTPDAEPATIARLMPILRTLDAHGVLALPLTPAHWREAHTEEHLAELRDELAGDDRRGRLREPWGLNAPSVGHWEQIFATTNRLDYADEWDDDDWLEDAEDAEDGEGPEDPAHAMQLGWRTRPVLLALLGAAALTRRAQPSV